MLLDLKYLAVKLSPLIILPANELLELFLVNYERIINSYAPFKVISMNKRKRRFNPWIRKEIKTLIVKKNKLFESRLNEKPIYLTTVILKLGTKSLTSSGKLNLLTTPYL